MPLNVCGPKAQPPKWKPLLLTSHCTSSEKELGAVARSLCEIQAHTRHDLPVCCDMKVRLQLLKFLHSVAYEKYDMDQLMFFVPLHHGTWHPYKYCAILIWRKFHPLLNCQLKGDLKIGDEVVCHRKLVYVTRLFSALFLACQSTRGLVDTIVHGLSAIHNPTSSDRVAVIKMKGLQTLLYTYSPIFFLLGFCVRPCTWKGQQQNSGSKAKDVLQRWLITMLATCGTHSPAVE